MERGCGKLFKWCKQVKMEVKLVKQNEQTMQIFNYLSKIIIHLSIQFNFELIKLVYSTSDYV